MRSPVTLCLAPFSAALLLAGGCSQAPATPDEQAIPVEPDGGIGDGAPPIPFDPPLGGEFAPEPVAQIPERFRGVWDYVEGSCMASSDLRIDIGPDRIEFYESLGTVESVEVDGVDTMIVTLAIEGEGETWETATRYVLTQDGERLTPYPVENRAGYEPMPLKRCP
ncbi:hypothetical protein QQS45_09350 [Alteriqipengyuania flavescens]|uniref:hypothetical protein n=1 Tax=Alteriqipengyuania flavescens TaxID=3053610 RepID=UPI0025B62490|nr:hypothetical protein [Alteriqipengyuania flavescens]WJY17835.1 hypothetical protein QQW98_09345 [Alteriqipengyuania flavescens]WJY23776.1 hypothetical protein QQS45_09350 [Alteriqipengyuania flavescens]